jgi:hypothetical protein
MEATLTLTPDQESVVKRLQALIDTSVPDSNGVLTTEKVQKFVNEVIRCGSSTNESDFEVDDNSTFNQESLKKFWHSYVGDLVRKADIKLPVLHKFFTKNKAINQGLAHPEMVTSSTRVKVGNPNDHRSKLGARILVNHPDIELVSPESFKGISVHDDEPVIVLKFNTNSGGSLIAKIETMYAQIQEYVSKHGNDKEKRFITSFKLQYHFDEKSLTVGITTTNPQILIGKLAWEYISSLYFKNAAVDIQLDMSTHTDFEDLAKKAQDKKFSFMEYLSKNFQYHLRYTTNCTAILLEVLKKVQFEKKATDTRGLSVPFMSSLLCLIQPGSDTIQHYKALTTFQILDFVIPSYPKHDFDKDGLREKFAKGITKPYKDESAKERYPWIVGMLELVKGDCSGPIKVSVRISNIFATATLETRGVVDFLQYLENLLEKAENSSPDNSEGSAEDPDESD